MNPQRFASQVYQGNKVLEKIKGFCEENSLECEKILYEYFPLFIEAKTKAELKIILDDIKNYNPKNNLLNKKEFMEQDARIKKTVNPPSVEEGDFVCRNKKCRSKKILFSQAQLRSADEPMTQLFRCAVCSEKWKINI